MSLGACGGSGGTAAQDAAAGAAAAPTGPVEPPTATCKVDAAVDAATREALGKLGVTVVEALGAKDFTRLEPAVHELIGKGRQTEQLAKAFQGIAERLPQPPGKITLARVVLLEGERHTRVPARVGCDAAGEPLEVVALLDAGRAAAVEVLIEGPAALTAVVVDARPQGDAWKVLGLSSHLAGARGLTPEQLAAMASEDEAAGRKVAALLEYTAAAQLAGRGTQLEPGKRKPWIEAAKRLGALPEAAQLRGTWALAGGESLEVLGVMAGTTPNDVMPTLGFVSGAPLEQAKVQSQARALVAALRTKVPGIDDAFVAVQLRAFAESPKDPAKTYESVQLVVPLLEGAAGEAGGDAGGAAAVVDAPAAD